ncbi:MAG: oligosaccharide flippase family protein [Gammaproteobacteria bacterium]
MSDLRYSLLASLAGKAIYALSSLSMLPLVTRLLGAESVGLLGFFTTLLMVLMVLEGGLTSAIIRELAGHNRQRERTAVRYLRYTYSLTNTYLLFFLGIGFLVALIVMGGAGILATGWLKFEVLTISLVKSSIICMGLFIGLNFPILILQGALIGSEMQISMNLLYVPYALLRTFGVLSVLHLVGERASVELFFSLQVLVQIIYLIGLLFLFYNKGGWLFLRSSPRWRILRRGFQFSAGVMLISLTSVVVVQFDKVYLSGLFPLEQYAVYALASTFSGIPYIFSSALQAVLFPRFSMNIAAGDHHKIERMFRGALSGFGMIVIALCCAVWFFSIYPLRLFFDGKLASDVAQVLPILLMGTVLQSLLIIPYALQLAAGWTSLALRLNLCSIPFIVVALPLMTNSFGMAGAAWVWFGYNLISFSATFYFVLKHFCFLRPAFFNFMKLVAFFVFLACPIFAAVLMWIVPELSNGVAVAAQVLVVAALTILVGVLFRRDMAGFL